MNLWLAQIAAIMRIEIKKSFWGKRAWWIYLLALGPVFLTASHTLFEMRRSHPRAHLNEDMMVFAGIFHFFYLKLGIFFGCVGIFSNLFRGEVLERTLHYYLLAPVRREVLLIAKYASGLAASLAFFGCSVAASFLLIGAHSPAALEEFLYRGPGLGHLGGYVLTAAMACVGYGAVFLMMGMLYRNPMIPAAGVMIWEAINGFLPPLLKKVSITFYLKSLAPVAMTNEYDGIFALLALDAAPAPAWVAILGLAGVAGVVVWLSARRARGLEISYSE